MCTKRPWNETLSRMTPLRGGDSKRGGRPPIGRRWRSTHCPPCVRNLYFIHILYLGLQHDIPVRYLYYSHSSIDIVYGGSTVSSIGNYRNIHIIDTISRECSPEGWLQGNKVTMMMMTILSIKVNKSTGTIGYSNYSI